MVTYARCDSDGSIVVLEWVPSGMASWAGWWMPIVRRDNANSLILGPYLSSDPYASTESALAAAVRLSPSLGAR